MKDIRIGRIYSHNHKKYEVVGLGKMRIHTDNWVDSVSYMPYLQDENGNIPPVTEVNTCDKKYFEKTFIPSYLEVGDIVCASSMGKILAEYEVISMDEAFGLAAFFKKLDKNNKYSDTKLVAHTQIAPNGLVTIDEPDPTLMHISCLEYWLMTPSIQRTLQNRETISHGRSILMEISEKFGKVNIAEVDNLYISKYIREFQALKDKIEKDKSIWQTIIKKQ